MKLLTLHIVFFALFFAVTGASAASCLPISTTTPTSCSNDFDLGFPPGNETSLTSSVEKGTFWTSIKHRFESTLRDAFVNVAWKDKNGGVLFEGTNRNWQGLTVKVDTYAWGETRWGFFRSDATKVVVGKADFNGSIGINQPCSGLICDAGYHEFLPSPLGSGSGAGSGKSVSAVVTGEPGTPIATIEGTITTYDTDPSAPDDLDLATSLVVLGFSSSVEMLGSDYLYTYAITNHTDATFDVAWSDAALTGVLNENESMTRSLLSSLPPGLAQSVTETRLGSVAISGGLGLIQPVPLPPSIVLFTLALGALATRLRFSSI